MFRFYLYYRSVIYRPIFGGNPIYGSVVVVFLSAAVHLIAIALGSLVVYAGYRFYEAVTSSPPATLWLLHTFIVSVWNDDTNVPHYFAAGAVYLIYSAAIGYASAKVFRVCADGHRAPRRMLYGSFSDHIDSSADNLLTAFVLTKVTHENKRLMYAGIPAEIGLGDGAKIAYIVLEDPAKFYLLLDDDQPRTTFHNLRPIGEQSISSIFISAEDTENIHLESWSFPDRLNDTDESTNDQDEQKQS